MRFIFLVCLAFALVAPTLAARVQYAPKAGETVMKISIEGRGDIYVLVHTKKAPKTSEHILRLARGQFYDGQRFHKVDRSPRPYAVRFGDPQTKVKDLDDPSIGKGGTGAKIPFEDTGFSHVEGAVGLAHPEGKKDEGDSQFYLLIGPATFLDGSYTVFGKVVAGMDVLKKVERGDRVVSVTVIGG